MKLKYITMNPSRSLTLTLLAISALALTGCNAENKVPSIDQSSVCRYNSDETARACKNGQLAFFQPSSFGNEQLPLMAAAAYCDFNHAVMHTNGGVVCVFTTQRMSTPAASK